MDKQVLKKGLRLYYNILKLHRRKLPVQFRKLGDLYVRQEFKHHHSNPNPEYYLPFYNEWVKYYEQLNKQGLKGVSKSMDQSTQKLLNNDQKQALQSLKTGVEKLKN